MVREGERECETFFQDRSKKERKTMSTPLLKANLTGTIKGIGYWVTTTIITLELLAGGFTDLIHGGTGVVTGPPVADILAHLGYPEYLLTILGVWKIPGAIVLLIPGFGRLKEWAYAGTFFVYTGAVASGLVLGRNDPATLIWGPLVFAILTLASWALRPQSRMLGTLFPVILTRRHEEEGSPNRIKTA